MKSGFPPGIQTASSGRYPSWRTVPERFSENGRRGGGRQSFLKRSKIRGETAIWRWRGGSPRSARPGASSRSGYRTVQALRGTRCQVEETKVISCRIRSGRAISGSDSCPRKSHGGSNPQQLRLFPFAASHVLLSVRFCPLRQFLFECVAGGDIAKGP